MPVAPRLRLLRVLPALFLAAACRDQTTAPELPPQPEPAPAPRVVAAFEITITGMAGPGPSASVQAVPYPPAQALAPRPSFAGITFESVSASRMTHGVRGNGGQRYFTGTFLVRNTTGAPLQNLTFVPVAGTTTITGTPWRSVTLYDGTSADSALIANIVPTGSVNITDDGGLRATLVDVMQVYEESELAGITFLAPDTALFPFGFVVRNRRTPNSRTLPSTTDQNDFAGSFTFAFRHPLPASSSGDPNTYSFRVYAVEDTETRMTESIEEAQDTAAVRLIRARAAALGATTVTVLAGSTVTDPAVPDYPGQRQICSVRAVGPASAPTAYMTNPGAYARVMVLRPGESLDPCAAGFRGGTPERPATAVPFPLTLAAVDLYGNLLTTEVDTVRLESVSGPIVSFGPATALVNGQAAIQATWTTYGTALLRGVGRRIEGRLSVPVVGITRTWTGNVDTNWSNGGNWLPLSPPGGRDSVLIPGSRLRYPALAGSVGLYGVTVQDGGTISLGVHNLSVLGNVSTGTTGSITGTTGKLVLTATNATLQGILPRLQVTGTYSTAGPVNARAVLQVEKGRLRTTGFRVQIDD